MSVAADGSSRSNWVSKCTGREGSRSFAMIASSALTAYLAAAAVGILAGGFVAVVSDPPVHLADQLLDQERLLVGAARRGDAADRLAAVFLLDALHLRGGEGDAHSDAQPPRRQRRR